MSRKGPGKGPQRRAPKDSPYAGLVTCLRCDREFWSWDRRQNRLCLICRETIDREPSEEPRPRFIHPGADPETGMMCEDGGSTESVFADVPHLAGADAGTG
jgi:hypothetical protein